MISLQSEVIITLPEEHVSIRMTFLYQMLKGTVRVRISSYKEFVSSRFVSRKCGDLIPCNLNVEDPLDKTLPFNDAKRRF